MTDVDRAGLAYLSDVAGVHELFCRYCDALDSREWDLLSDVFLPDAIAYFPTGTDEQMREEMSIQGRDNIVGWLRQIFLDFGPTHHMVSNLVLSRDGDVRKTACRVRAHHVALAGDERIFEESLARFSGTVRLTSTGWRFQDFRENIAIALGDMEGVARLAEGRGSMRGDVDSHRDEP